MTAAGVPEAQAEAMADATRELFTADVATKADITALRAEIAALEQRMMTATAALELRLTIRLGGLIAVAVAVPAAIIKL